MKNGHVCLVMAPSFYGWCLAEYPSENRDWRSDRGAECDRHWLPFNSYNCNSPCLFTVGVS